MDVVSVRPFKYLNLSWSSKHRRNNVRSWNVVRPRLWRPWREPSPEFNFQQKQNNGGDDDSSQAKHYIGCGGGVGGIIGETINIAMSDANKLNEMK